MKNNILRNVIRTKSVVLTNCIKINTFVMYKQLNSPVSIIIKFRLVPTLFFKLQAWLEPGLIFLFLYVGRFWAEIAAIWTGSSLDSKLSEFFLVRLKRVFHIKDIFLLILIYSCVQKEQNVKHTQKMKNYLLNYKLPDIFSMSVFGNVTES